MVKKLQKMAAKKSSKSDGTPNSASNGSTAMPAGMLDSQFAQSVKDSAQHIWAAGLGAFSKAQGEGGKVFEALVKEGLTLQKKTQSAAEDKLGAMASKMSGMAGDVGNKAGKQWDKLEFLFEDRVAQALKRLGVPSAKDVAALTARLDALSSAADAKPPGKRAGKTVAGKTALAKAPPKAIVKRVAKARVATPMAEPVAAVVVKPAAKPVLKRVVKKRAAAVTAATNPEPSAPA